VVFFSRKFLQLLSRLSSSVTFSRPGPPSLLELLYLIAY
jgi:hypothetical protein